MKVVVKNNQYYNTGWAFVQPELFEYSGELVDLKHIADWELALTTGNAEWPVRVLQKNLIVSIDGKPYAYTASPSAVTAKKTSKKRRINNEHSGSVDVPNTNTNTTSISITEWHVQGSKGKTYSVTKNGVSYRCTCSGFAFRKHCKHVELIKNQNNNK